MEANLDCNFDGNGLTVLSGRLKAPFLNCFDGTLIDVFLQRFDDANLPGRTGGGDDHADLHGA